MPSRFRRMFATGNGQSLFVPFCLISSLFLLWGFCNGLIDVMDKHFQDSLNLTKAESAWVQTAHYLGYAVMALPAGLLTQRIGYKGGILVGLAIVSAGGFWFIAATTLSTLWAFLVGVGLIAMGLTVLETVANPYATVLGPKPFSAFRINLAQSLNGIGWMLGPLVGSAFFYTAEASDRLYVPYVAIALLVLVMMAVFRIVDVPDLVPPEDTHALEPLSGSIWSRPHFAGAVFAQFLYVAAQAGIFSFFINYMVSDAAPALVVDEQGAAQLQGLVGFGLFLAGRLVGTALLTRMAPHRLLAIYSLANVLLCAIVVMKLGWLSVLAVFLSFFFMSIGFPTIFSLGLDGLGRQTKKASAFIVMAILGGAIMPKLMGYLGDVYDMSTAFIVPLGCFIGISLYAYAWLFLRRQA